MPGRGGSRGKARGGLRETNAQQDHWHPGGIHTHALPLKVHEGALLAHHSPNTQGHHTIEKTWSRSPHVGYRAGSTMND